MITNLIGAQVDIKVKEGEAPRPGVIVCVFRHYQEPPQFLIMEEDGSLYNGYTCNFKVTRIPYAHTIVGCREAGWGKG